MSVRRGKEEVKATDEYEERDNESGDDESSAVYISMIIRQGRFGFAAYDVDTAKLEVAEWDIADAEVERTLDIITTQTSPCEVLVSARNIPRYNLLEILNPVHRQYEVKIRKVRYFLGGGFNKSVFKTNIILEFDYNRACCTIETMKIGVLGEAQEFSRSFSRRDLKKFQNSYLNFELREMIAATGALLAYLSQEKVRLVLIGYHKLATGSGLTKEGIVQIVNQLDTENCVSVRGIDPFILNEFMTIDPVAFRSLQIFCTETHPSQIKGPGRSKEGFSLNGILDRTKCLSGKKLLKRWMLRPLTDIPRIKSRHDAVGFFSAECHRELTSKLAKLLRGFKDVSRILLRFKTASAKVNDWISLHESIISFMNIRHLIFDEKNTLRDAEELPVLLNQILQQEDLTELNNLLGNIVDFEECVESQHFTVRVGISDELDSLRNLYENMDQSLVEITRQLAERHLNITFDKVQYFPRVGYVVSSMAALESMPGDFIFQFQDGERKFFKEETCKQLDENPGDVLGFIADVQEGGRYNNASSLSNEFLLIEAVGIKRQLITAILERENCVQTMTDAVAELDCLTTFARVAIDLGYVKPDIHDGPCIEITKARHPLQELAVDPYIPNDFTIARSQKSGLINVITGPNGSGKSVFLKMMGLIPYMAQIGSFVPAEAARLGIVSSIFTRIQSLETATLPQSSFTIDCNQISLMLNHCNSRSILLIDEFGKGTSFADGVALLASTLKHLAEIVIKQGGPIVIVSTHFFEIFRMKILNSYIISSCLPLPSSEEDNLSSQISPQHCIACYTSDVAFEKEIDEITDVEEDESNAAKDKEDMIPLYSLKLGIAESSSALRCAQMHGIHADVIERASEIRHLRRKGLPVKSLNSTYGALMQDKAEALWNMFQSVSNWNECSAEKLAELMEVARSMDQ